MNSPKKHVAIFGVFDGLHDGHRYFIERARSFGDSLSVIVAQDEVVEAMKKRTPEQTLEARIAALVQAFPDVSVHGGDRTSNEWRVLAEVNPSVIALGYDQKELQEALKEYYRETEVGPEIIIIESHRGEELHSSILKNAK